MNGKCKTCRHRFHRSGWCFKLKKFVSDDTTSCLQYDRDTRKEHGERNARARLIATVGPTGG